MVPSYSLKRLVDDVASEIQRIPIDDFPNISIVKHRLGEMVATSDFITEDELEARIGLAELFVQKYAHSGSYNTWYLQEAIEQYETTLNRLPPDSPRQTEYLSSLSNTYLSMFLFSNSDHDINEAVRFGRLAKQQAETTGLGERDPEAHRSVLINNIAALSHFGELLMRAGAADTHQNRVVDILNEVVECIQGIRTNTSVGSETYFDSLHRLTNVLISKAFITGSMGDREEAAKLIQEMQSAVPPGSELHSEAKLQLGFMAALIYNSGGELEYLDDAIMQIQTGLEDIGMVGSSRIHRPTALSHLAQLYGVRYSALHNISNLHEALHLSNLSLFGFYPVSDPGRGEILLRHLQISRQLAYALTSEDEIKNVLQYAYLHLWRKISGYEAHPVRYSGADYMSEEKLPFYVERGKCERLFCDILGRRYMVTRKLEHLNHTLAFMHDFRLGLSGQDEQFEEPLQSDATAVSTLANQVRQLVLAPQGPARDAGADAVHERFREICDGMDFVDDLLTKVTDEFTASLRLYVEAATGKTVIADQSSQKTKASGLPTQTVEELPETKCSETARTWSCDPGSTRATHGTWAACCPSAQSCKFFTSCHASTATGIDGSASICSGTSLDCCTTTIYQSHPSSFESWSAIGCAQRGCDTSILDWGTEAQATPMLGPASEPSATVPSVLSPLLAGTGGASEPVDTPHTASLAIQLWIVGSAMILAAILAVWFRRRNGQVRRRGGKFSTVKGG
ncbi:hypothetical protein QBC47DRAFT_457215 [Echria macrotheca]|uniref:Uncharacterized protein n=1 Tax=Echria macrotheca TaxID=438768 RepID=A0AAJ0BKI4_9PEZI|nr:hypothetical protein QBC47DRAFT_457215 [Echria macrotheca]